MHVYECTDTKANLKKLRDLISFERKNIGRLSGLKLSIKKTVLKNSKETILSISFIKKIAVS